MPQKEKINLKLPNLTGLLNNKTVGQAAGAYLFIDAQAKANGVTTTSAIESIITGLVSNPHLPDLNSVMAELTGGIANAQIKQFIKLWLLGYGLKQIKVGTKYGNMAQNFSESAVKGILASTVIGFSGAWNSPPSFSGSFMRQAKPVGTYEY